MLLDSTTSQLTNDGERSPASGSTSMFANPSTQTTHLSLQEGGENAETRLSAPTGLGTYVEPTPQGVDNQATGKQKKQPSLAVIACRQCRSRKVRCDSVRPKCGNCSRRAADCEFDVVPKRRGPDRAPGTRHRSCKKRPVPVDCQENSPLAQSIMTGTQKRGTSDGLDADPRQLKKRKSGLGVDTTNRPLNAQTQSPPEGRPEPSMGDTIRGALLFVDEDDTVFEPPPVVVSWRAQKQARSFNSQPISPHFNIADDAFDILHTMNSITPDFFTFGKSTDLSSLDPSEPIVLNTTPLPFFEGFAEQYTPIPRGPSMEFTKQTWWDNLLECYSNDPQHSSKKILQDLHFLFKNTVFWISFINVPNFLDRLNDPIQRLSIQPSFVIAALALATFMKSSEMGMGHQGRTFSLWLRDVAQSALDGSLAVGWIDSGLAQAAYLLAMYEASAHPDYAPSRVVSAIRILDGLIHTFGLTFLDAAEPTVSIFPADGMPLATAPPPPVHNTYHPNPPASYPVSNTPVPNVGSHPLAPGPHLASIRHRVNVISLDDGIEMPRCGCQEHRIFPLGPKHSTARFGRTVNSQRMYRSQHDPDADTIYAQAQSGGDDFRGVFTDWPDHWSPTETKREEDRRLCWSALTLVCSVCEYTQCFIGIPFDLFVTRQENYTLFFPGEYLCKTTVFKPHKPKESIWALHCRTNLLWVACHRLKDSVKGNSGHQLVQEAWKELEEIEAAQNWHTCLPANGLMFIGREQVNNLRIMVSNSFARFVPLAFPETSTNDCAQAWLQHRREIVKHVRKTVQFVAKFGTRVATVALAKRPLGIWWSMFQIRGGLEVWRVNRTLKQALEQSLDYLALTDFLSTMWPCHAQFVQYTQLRNELIEACMSCGISIPQAVPIPGVMGDKPGSGWMTPSPALCVKKTDHPSDIPILAVD